MLSEAQQRRQTRTGLMLAVAIIAAFVALHVWAVFFLPLSGWRWALALGAGGADEGPPGLRPHYHPHYYGAYCRDLDGNKICVCHHGGAPKRNAGPD